MAEDAANGVSPTHVMIEARIRVRAHVGLPFVLFVFSQSGDRDRRYFDRDLRRYRHGWRLRSVKRRCKQRFNIYGCKKYLYCQQSSGSLVHQLPLNSSKLKRQSKLHFGLQLSYTILNNNDTTNLFLIFNLCGIELNKQY